MAMIDIYNVNGEKISQRDVKGEVFNVAIREDLIHQVVRAQLATYRSGTASSKDRSRVKASKRKLWRQKGTGRARVGAASSPIRRGGGVTFGPMPRDFSPKVNKKVRKSALRMALADKFKAGQIRVLDGLQMEEIKTKQFTDILKNLELTNVLIITEKSDEKLDKSSRNVPNVKLLRAEGLNVYDILTHECLLFTEPALGVVEEKLVS
ncbi:MAG: 50S ribosomal protein L4 [Deltaproteobacteria bacterium]|mgnify:CR=1 FL=1|nr:50S ribosomal protein L4 [Deltaproteobacteria bacterium]MBW2076663.1 50S ribosomal protein L4 [Deltaproteobacteria bacterium]